MGIKAGEDEVGSRHAPTRWIFTRREPCFVFCVDFDYWGPSSSFLLPLPSRFSCFFPSTGCRLPSLSSLLSHPAIDAQDGFTLVFQIQTPPSFRPELPGEQLVPVSLLQALESSLDNDRTGDVKVRSFKLVFHARSRRLFGIPELIDDLSFLLSS